MTVLYVIGNGFDLHHKIASNYRDFGVFLTRNHQDLRTLLDEFFPTHEENDFWNNFEARLAEFDADSLIEKSQDLIVSYAAEDWTEAFNHNYAFELDRVVKELSEGLLEAFSEWVRQISIPSLASLTVPALRLNPDARFVSFNYTDTLQRLYRVPTDRVWHIHGAAAASERLILGHAWRPKPTETRLAKIDPELDDTRLIEGASIIDRYFESTFKPTEKIIADNEVEFARLADVEDIRILGHSLSDVDLPYLRKIAACVRPSARWRVSSRNTHATKSRFEKFAPPSKATFLPLAEV